MRCIVITVSLVLTCPALAQNKNGLPNQGSSVVWQPPTLELPDNLPEATVRKPIVTALRVGKSQVTLEKTTLSGTQKLLGGTTGHRGDAGDYVEWLCLHGTDANGQWALWLESSEVAGGVVDGFALQRMHSNATPDRRCSTLPEGVTVFTSPVQVA